MATWMAHLRVAEKLLASLPHLDEGAFTYGNLAPDSGVPNVDWTVFDPPKEVTHFLRPGESEDRIADLLFYRTYLAELVPARERARYSFVFGYFVHLLCDNLWARRIVRRSALDHASLFVERGTQAWSDLKRDWYGLDRRYVRDHPHSLFWRVFMRAPNPPAYLPFLPELALNQQFDRIREFYSKPGQTTLERPYPFLNESAMDRYVEDSAVAVLKIRRVLKETSAPDDANSALELLTAEEIGLYDSPLGDSAGA